MQMGDGTISDRDRVSDIVKGIVSDQYEEKNLSRLFTTKRPKLVVTEDTKLDQNEFDSLDLVEICITIEDIFQIEVTDEDFLACTTVGKLVEFCYLRTYL